MYDEAEHLARRAPDRHARRCAGCRHRPSCLGLNTRSQIRGSTTVVNLVGRSTVEILVRPVFVVPVKVAEKLFAHAIAPQRDHDAARALGLEGANEALEDGGACVHAHGAEARPDASALAPGPESVAAELPALVADEVVRLGRRARLRDGRAGRWNSFGSLTVRGSAWSAAAGGAQTTDLAYAGQVGWVGSGCDHPMSVAYRKPARASCRKSAERAAFLAGPRQRGVVVSSAGRSGC